MPHVRALAARRFSEAGPLPQVLNLGMNVVVMLLCLKNHQALRAPEGDIAETVFTVLSGWGYVVEGEARHVVQAGDVVHVMPGVRKALIAGAGELTVLGVRHLKGGSS